MEGVDWVPLFPMTTQKEKLKKQKIKFEQRMRLSQRLEGRIESD